jgi:glycosyltransferase involved in cell wall biosynthesis
MAETVFDNEQNNETTIPNIEGQKRIRVAFVGNIANNFFREVQALRNYSDIDAVLFMHHRPETSNTDLPESDDPTLDPEKYPNWLRILPKISGFNFNILTQWIPKSSGFKQLIAELNMYDICVFSGSEVFFIPYVNTKTIYRATGSDLTVFPVLSYQQFFQLRPHKKRKLCKQPLKYFVQLLEYYLTRSSYRKAVHNSNYINVSPAVPYKTALNKLKEKNDRKIDIFSLAIDTSLFYRNASKDGFAAKRWGIVGYEFVALMPSRVMIKNTQVHRDTGQWKASDKAICAFQLFLESLTENEKSKVVLLIPDRTKSDDLEIAKVLISDLGIDKNVLFLKGDAETGLTRNELIQLYSLSDVVLDDFGAGWYGSVVVEAMSCSCPVITYVPKSVMSKFSWHPIQIAKSKEEILKSLLFLYRHADKRQEVANKSRLWVEEFHSEESVSKSLACSLKSLI